MRIAESVAALAQPDIGVFARCLRGRRDWRSRHAWSGFCTEGIGRRARHSGRLDAEERPGRREQCGPILCQPTHVFHWPAAPDEHCSIEPILIRCGADAIAIGSEKGEPSIRSGRQARSRVGGFLLPGSAASRAGKEPASCLWLPSPIYPSATGAPKGLQAIRPSCDLGNIVRIRCNPQEHVYTSASQNQLIRPPPAHVIVNCVAVIPEMKQPPAGAPFVAGVAFTRDGASARP